MGRLRGRPRAARCPQGRWSGSCVHMAVLRSEGTANALQDRKKQDSDLTDCALDVFERPCAQSVKARGTVRRNPSVSSRARVLIVRRQRMANVGTSSQALRGGAMRCPGQSRGRFRSQASRATSKAPKRITAPADRASHLAIEIRMSMVANRLGAPEGAVGIDRRCPSPDRFDLDQATVEGQMPGDCAQCANSRPIGASSDMASTLTTRRRSSL